jgi:hypothetical protein
MNQRETKRVEKYLITYPQIASNPTALEQLKVLCADPSIGHPCNADNQKRFRHARKLRDTAVAELAKSIV